MQRFQTLISFIILVFLCNQSWARVNQDLKVCKTYEFHGQLSDDLKESAKLSTTAESGLQVDLIIEPNEETSLDVIALKGKSVVAKALVIQKISARSYKAKVSYLVLDKPSGLGAGRGNIKARLLDVEADKTCKE